MHHVLGTWIVQQAVHCMQFAPMYLHTILVRNIVMNEIIVIFIGTCLWKDGVLAFFAYNKTAVQPKPIRRNGKTHLGSRTYLKQNLQNPI